MRVIGLTGGIASGKSTVARLFAERGVPVVDADQLARDVVRPGQPAYNDIIEAFGREMLQPNGEIDRKRLAARVFSDGEARRRLNAITHPRIAERSQSLMTELAAKGVPVALYEAALLVENGVHRALPGLIVVSAKPETQLRRLVERDHLDPTEAQARLDAQAPLADKLAAATWVIDNDGDADALRARVDAVLADLRARAA
jgi:dephospho-CoA kinase